MRNLAKIARDLAANMRDGAAALEEAAVILEQSTVVRVAERLGMLTGSVATPVDSPEPVKPVEPLQTVDLRPFYRNVAELQSDARRISYQYAISVDDVAVHPGFGPANKYRTNADGSVSAK